MINIEEKTKMLSDLDNLYLQMEKLQDRIKTFNKHFINIHVAAALTEVLVTKEMVSRLHN